MGIIDIVNVSKVYNNNVCAIKNINLSINKGDIFGIIGLSGAGKSTLIRCINYLERPTTGSVLFNGEDLGAIKESQLREKRKKIGMIFQGFNLLEQRTVLKNVMFPLELNKGYNKSEAKEKAIKLLHLVGLEDKLDSYPSQLSGGQCQRVAIARSLANDPEVLLCDEATSALDPKTTDSILELIKKINEELNITVILITHEMRVIESICNKVAIIDNSQICEIGEVKEVFSNPQTQIAKNLIMPQALELKCSNDKKLLRLIFDGTVTEPVISKMIQKLNIDISISSANVKQVNSNTIGEMIIEINKKDLDDVKKFLTLYHVNNVEV